MEESLLGYSDSLQFSLEPSVFSVFLICGVLFGILTAFFRSGITGISKDSVINIALFSIPLGVLGARIVFCLYHCDRLIDGGFAYIIHMENGGFSFIGATIGLFIALLVVHLISHENLIAIADTILPGLLIVLAMERFGEQFTENGIGLEIELPGLSFFPITRSGPYEDTSVLAVNLFEGMTALITALYTVRLKRSPGQITGICLIIVLAIQIIWETLRRDDRLMLDMASFLMIFCAVALFIYFVFLLIFSKSSWVRKTIYAICFTGAYILIGLSQFFMDGKILLNVPISLCLFLTTISVIGVIYIMLQTLLRNTFHSSNL